MTNTEYIVRASAFGDYLAIDRVDQDMKIENTVFYIQEGRTLKVTWRMFLGKPQTWKYKMVNGKLYTKRIAIDRAYTEVRPQDLLKHHFEYALRITKPRKLIRRA